jgi:hypothetical protein
MQNVGGDGRGLQPPGQFVGEQNVGELGLVVGTCAGVGLGSLQVVEVDSPAGVHVGSDRHDASGDAVLQPVEEKVGE